jgi:SulP family sulfate permease
MKNWKQQWFFNVRNDLLAGTVVALALIPEAIAFSIVAGVDPKVGLYTAFCIAVTAAIFGGRPAMISAATGAISLLLVTLVRQHGLEYLFAASVLAGVIQILFGWRKLGRYMKFVPKPVMLGFVNALAILIFMAQMPHFAGASWQMYAMIAASLVIIYGFPYITKAIPSPLVAIVIMTIVAVVFKSDVRTVGAMGELPKSLPLFSLPHVPLNLETLSIILPYSLPMAIVGLLESLLTANFVDDLTETPSDKNQESIGQGIANIVSGCFGGMAGCAMIGQSIINVKSGGRGRLSSLWAGVFLMFLILVLSDWVKLLPMGALVAVMFMVCVSTFNWASLKEVTVAPRSEVVVMFATIVTVLYTHDLAKGVGVGVILSAIAFARKLSKVLRVESALNEAGTLRTYVVWGQLFFVSTEQFLSAIDFREKVERVHIDLTHSHLWDASAVGAIDKAVFKLRRNGVAVELIGMNEASKTIIDRLALHDKEGAAEAELAH